MFKKIVKLLLPCIAVIVIGIIVFTELKDRYLPEKQPQDVMVEEARRWVREHSPTYTFDGMELEFVQMDEISSGVYDVLFEFKSRYTGYGDRTEQVAAPAVTSHKIELRVQMIAGEDRWEITRAVTDDIFDEINGIFLDERMKKESVAVKLYFIRVEDGREEFIPLSREITAGSRIEKRALEALLSGPSEKEKENGYMTAINEEVRILDFNIEKNRAKVSFSKELDQGISGSATVTAIRDQIKNTLTQFDRVGEVEISIDGKTVNILQP